MELISRKDTWREFISQIEDIADLEDIDRILSSMPTIEERKEGEWIHDIHYGLKLPEHRCSICGEWEYSDTESKFCPNCGAYMKGE